MAQINAKYQVKNAAGTYDEMMFETLGSQVIEDATNRFATDTEKATWNAKASTAAVTTTGNGLMEYADKVKLNGIATGANAYVHPATHPASVIVQDVSNRFATDTEKAAWNGKASTTAVTTTSNGLMAYADKVKLNGIATGANAYVHPTTHPPAIIQQDASNRFATDVEKATWNNKADKAIYGKYYNSAGQGFANMVTSLITFNTVEHLSGAGFTFNGTNKFTCAIAGLYHLDLNLILDGVAGGYACATIARGSTEISSSGSVFTTGSYSRMCMSCDVLLSVGEYLTFPAVQISNITVGSIAGRTWFSYHKIN